MLAIDDTLEILGVELIGVIPEDELIFRSSNLGEPVVTDKKSPAGEAYLDVVKRVMGQDVEFSEMKEKPSFSEKLKKFFGSR